MSFATIDNLAPIVMLVCGALICLLFEWPYFQKILKENATPWADRMRAHRSVAPLILIIGSIWVLQRLWLT